MFMNIFLSSWWGLMLFFIYLSGLLVLFSYFAAFSAKDNISFDVILAILLSPSFYLFSDFIPLNSSLLMSWIWTNKFLFILMSLTLLIIMVIICMICFKIKQPFRPFF